eukprot:2092530-Prymnesium_polylepis.1
MRGQMQRRCGAHRVGMGAAWGSSAKVEADGPRAASGGEGSAAGVARAMRRAPLMALLCALNLASRARSRTCSCARQTGGPVGRRSACDAKHGGA